MCNYCMDNGYFVEEVVVWVLSNVIGNLGINFYGSVYFELIGYDGKLVVGVKLLWDDSWDDVFL